MESSLLVDRLLQRALRVYNRHPVKLEEYKGYSTCSTYYCTFVLLWTGNVVSHSRQNKFFAQTHCPRHIRHSNIACPTFSVYKICSLPVSPYLILLLSMLIMRLVQGNFEWVFQSLNLQAMQQRGTVRTSTTPPWCQFCSFTDTLRLPDVKRKTGKLFSQPWR